MDEKTFHTDLANLVFLNFTKKKRIPESFLPCFLCHMPDPLLCDTDKTNYVHHG